MPRLRFETAREVFEAFPALVEDIQTPPTGEPPIAFMRALLASKTPEDALTFCAHTLPRREAVWWGCQCVRAMTKIAPGEEDPFLRSAENWVREPEDHRRMAALRLGMESERRAPTNWLALAAGWSGGNVSLYEGMHIAPKPDQTSNAIRTAILIALARVGAAGRRTNLGNAVEAGAKLMQPDAPA